MRVLLATLLSLATLLAAALFARPAQAVAPAIEILSPTPTAIHLRDAYVVFELQISTGEVGSDFDVEWDFNWDGQKQQWDASDTDFVFTVYCPAQGCAVPIRYAPGGDFANLRYTYVFSSGSYGLGQQFYRVRVFDDNNDQTVRTSSLFLVDELQLSGHTWFGASTNDLPPTDADLWVSFTCENEKLVCGTAPTYKVKYTKAPGGPFGQLADNAWLGAEEPVGAGSIGWLSFGKGVCNGGANAGLVCQNAGQCPGGTCVLTGTPPAGDVETWASYQELNHQYTAYTGICNGQSPSPGILCANNTYCRDGTHPNGACDYGTSSKNRYPGQFAGWGRLLTLRDYGTTVHGQTDWGWLHLRGAEAPEPSPDTQPSLKYTNITADAFLQCTDCSANASKCNVCASVDTVVGSSDPLQYYSCNSCYDCNPTTGTCDRCEACNLYGLSYNSQLSELVGFGWSGNDATGGFGWMQFDPTSGGVFILQAWLATRYGDIFSGGPITTTTPLPAPPGSFNATYVIQSGGSVDFSSQFGYIQQQYPSSIPLPSSANRYINVLGRIDFDELTKIGANRYGQTIDISGQGQNGIPPVLDGKIYYHKGDLAIGGAGLTFQPGSTTHSGAGTIIVDGNLTFNAEATYGTGTIASITNVPSVSWIVRGDVIVNPSVGTLDSSTDPSANLVGAFLILGCEGGTPAPSCGGTVKQGVFTSGVSDTLELIINGLIMARRFSFQRTVVSERGSEQVIYDGRLIANPPPGLADVSAVLPSIREVTP